jgi:serine/threonine-protein kinase RsbW
MVDSRGALAQDGRRAERLELRVPTTATQLPAVRAMAGDLAIRMDYDLDSVEDLRLAVDEACALLLPHAADKSTLDARFELHSGRLVVETTVATDESAEPDRSGFAWTVLGALASSVDVRNADGRLAITVTKAREAAAK